MVCEINMSMNNEINLSMIHEINMYTVHEIEMSKTSKINMLIICTFLHTLISRREDQQTF